MRQEYHQVHQCNFTTLVEMRFRSLGVMRFLTIAARPERPCYIHTKLLKALQGEFGCHHNTGFVMSTTWPAHTLKSTILQHSESSRSWRLLRTRIKASGASVMLHCWQSASSKTEQAPSRLWTCTGRFCLSARVVSPPALCI